MPTSRLTAWVMWIVASIFYAYQYLLRVMPNIVIDDIMQQFQIGAAAIGQFSSIYYIGYSLMHLPIGILLDRYGPKKIMSICILLTVIGLLPLIFATHWIYPIAGRALIGMGSSAAILGLFKIIRLSFSEEKFPRMLSISVMIGLLGAIYGGGPVGYLREIYGYHAVVQLFTLIGIVLMGITYWMIPNVKSSRPTSMMSEIKVVIFNKRVIWCCLFAGLMVGPLEGFADVWGRSFLKEVYQFDGTLAASLPSMIFIGMCFGAPILSLIAEKTGNHLTTIIGAGIIMTISFSSLLIWHLNTNWMGFNFIIVGICCAYQILAIYKASTYVSEQAAGLTTAVASMIIMIFGYTFHAIIGSIINVFGGPNNEQALICGIAVIPIGLTIGILGFVILFMSEQIKTEKELLPSS
ncbi:MFS transporter [Candidatus Protochlamydia amoebophila]|uniref:MFS transporter n=1 Tax=Candidatus Protochlamydia amoebophila TaxID=362787 RepID=UPI001BC9FA81|nr:MFS transporter [Candidatus Protochlamydia amoebophila]